MSIRVFVVDDEAMVRRGIEILLGREPGIEVCGQAAGAPEALKQILTLQPDLAIIDLTLLEGSGLELVRDVRAFGAKPRILVFSMHTQTAQIRDALRAGADGYVTKEEGTERLVEAIHAVMGGKRFLSAAVAARVGRLDAAPPTSATKSPGHN